MPPSPGRLLCRPRARLTCLHRITPPRSVLELGRRELTDGRMSSACIVPALDELKHRAPCFGLRPEWAVKTQVWIAISVYVLVAIVRKRLGIERDLYTILQILSVFAFEKAPLAQVLSAPGYTSENAIIRNQLSLFTF